MNELHRLVLNSHLFHRDGAQLIRLMSKPQLIDFKQYCEKKQKTPELMLAKVLDECIKLTDEELKK